jgi:hypothetical protein
MPTVSRPLRALPVRHDGADRRDGARASGDDRDDGPGGFRRVGAARVTRASAFIPRGNRASDSRAPSEASTFGAP